MKNKKIIYLTAFLLSLSLIFLLEASSLRLLAEDIKLPKKEKVEIELLLSASKQHAGGESQLDSRNEVKTKTKETAAQDQSEEVEVDKNSLAEKKTEIIKEKKEIVENKILEEKELPKKEVEKIENKQEKSQENNIRDKQQLNKNKEDTKIEKEDKTEPPAWMQNSASNSEKEESVEQKEQIKNDEFDLDSFIANLEAEADKESDSDKINKVNQENKAADIQSDQSSTAEEVNNNVEDKNNETTSNVSADNSAAVENETGQKNKVYDLRKGNFDSIKKPGVSKYSQPEYPSNLRRRNIEGKVIISLRIDKEGKIHDLKINESSGYESFDQAALKALRIWEFKAAEKDGEKIEVIVNLPIKFELH